MTQLVVDGCILAGEQHDIFANVTSTSRRNRYAEIFGEDPWADLANNPLRPTEMGGMLLRYRKEMETKCAILNL